MKILFILDQDEGIDPHDPVGDIIITNGHSKLSVESTYLDSWFDILIDGYQSLKNDQKNTLEILEEPDLITFEPVLDGFKISYGKQELFFKNLNEFYQSLLTSAQEFLRQLNQDQDKPSKSSLLNKIANFIQQANLKELYQFS
jgi:hypothetical protein